MSLLFESTGAEIYLTDSVTYLLGLVIFQFEMAISLHEMVILHA